MSLGYPVREVVDTKSGEVLPFVRSPFYSGGDVLTETVIEGESMTDQSQSDSVDINKIMRSVERTGIMPVNDRVPMFEDVTALQGDFTEMVNDSRAVQSVVKEKLDERVKAEEAEAAADREAGRAARAASKAAAASKEATSAPAKAGGAGDPSGSN